MFGGNGHWQPLNLLAVGVGLQFAFDINDAADLQALSRIGCEAKSFSQAGGSGDRDYGYCRQQLLQQLGCGDSHGDPS